MKKQIWFYLIVLCFLCNGVAATMRQAVTYDQSPGRFGDNLLSYIHAKWISYKHNIPLLYKPFVYSDCLALHNIEQWYTNELRSTFGHVVGLGKKRGVERTDPPSTLYYVPYFPESKYELKNGVSFSGSAWDSFEVDWSDEGFIEELRSVIAPIQQVARMYLPAERITVALHMRKGGTHDTPETLLAFPLKFLPDEFYIEQIRCLYGLLGESPLYVHLFTDDHDPGAIVKKFKRQLESLDITWGCRERENSETSNVIEDFFTLAQFECLIHSESNFSLIMNKMGNYMVTIYPDSFGREKGRIIYDSVNVQINMKG